MNPEAIGQGARIRVDADFESGDAPGEILRAAMAVLIGDVLSVRRWVCGDCGSVHDRDQNAALNIARLGCGTLGLKGPGSLGL